MKILSIGNFGTGWDGSICDEEHIAAALEDIGHDVNRWQRETVKDTYPRYYKPDFILIAQWDKYPENWQVSHTQGKSWEKVGFGKWLQNTFNCPVVYWTFDHQDRGQKWHLKLIEGCNLYLSKRLSDGDAFGKKWRWLSQDFAPAFLKPTATEKTLDVLFTGTYLEWAKERNETLKAIDDNFRLQIHSINPEAWMEAGFSNVAGPVMDQNLPELIGTAKINISIDHTIEAGYWSDRTAQILACGGFTLMRYVPLAETRFQEGVEFFHNPGQALSRVDEWLKRPDECYQHARTGHGYAHKYLMVQNRVEDLLTIVKDTVL